MRLIHTARFEKDYSATPTDVQRAFDKQERFLADNLQHPSLHAKKYGYIRVCQLMKSANKAVPGRFRRLS